MKRLIGTVTVQFYENGGRTRSINELWEHTENALAKAKFAEGNFPLRYDDFTIVAASMNTEK